MNRYCLPLLLLLASLAVSFGCVTHQEPRDQTSFLDPITPEPNDLSQARLIDVSSDTSATGDESSIVCTPPRPMVNGERNAQYAALRMAPYRACQGVAHEKISREAYREFFEEYFSLLVLTASIESLAQLERDTMTAPHRKVIEALASENTARKLMCAHPDLFAIDAGALDLCI